MFIKSYNCSFTITMDRLDWFVLSDNTLQLRGETLIYHWCTSATVILFPQCPVHSPLISNVTSNDSQLSHHSAFVRLCYYVHCNDAEDVDIINRNIFLFIATVCVAKRINTISCHPVIIIYIY